MAWVCVHVCLCVCACVCVCVWWCGGECVCASWSRDLGLLEIHQLKSTAFHGRKIEILVPIYPIFMCIDLLDEHIYLSSTRKHISKLI